MGKNAYFCANFYVLRVDMKTTLLVVGRTVEPYFVTAINEYGQRTRRYLPFDMEVIPELKNTKSLSEEVQKEKEGELILKSLKNITTKRNPMPRMAQPSFGRMSISSPLSSI